MNKIVKRVLLIILGVILVVALVGTITVYSIWHNELSSAFSIKKLRDRNDDNNEGTLYEMTISGDYYFEEFKDKGVSSDKELISYITNHITKGIIPMTIKETEIGCAAFTASLTNGDRVFGRNYDFSKTNTCIVKTNPSYGYASISTIDLQFLGIDCNSDVTSLMDKITMLAAPYIPLDGINEKGLACGIFMSYQGPNGAVAPTNQTTELPDFTSTTMLRMILDYAASVEEAVELVKKYDLHDSANTSYHYMIADETGKSAILEWVNGTDSTDTDGTKRKLVVTYNDDDSNIGKKEGDASFQWITNFIIQPNYYDNEEDMAGLDRYNTIYEGLNPTNGVLPNEKSAMDILKSVGQRNFNLQKPGVTVHSIVFNLTKRTYYMVPNENYNDEGAVYNYSF